MTRWISGIIIAVGIIFLLLYASQKGVNIAICVFAMIAVSEYFGLTQKNTSRWIIYSGVLLCGLGTAALIFWAESQEQVLTIFSVLFGLSLLLYGKGPADFEQRLKELAFFYFGLMYITLLFSYWARVRALDPWPFWVFLMLGATFMADTGGYVIGHHFGRHPLAPRVSPGKTVEGLLGSTVFAFGAALVVRFLFWPNYPLFKLGILSCLIAFVGLLGDLSESMIKRGVHAKDSGDLIPGHGGFLDRVDALLFTAPLVYYFAAYFP